MTQRKLTEYNQLEADLAELFEQSKSLVFDYESKAGNKDARSYVYSIRQKRSELESVRKEAKAAALEHGRQVDAKAKEIDGKLVEMINVHQQRLDEIKKRDDERIEKIQKEIEYIEQCSATTYNNGMHYSSEQLNVRLAEINRIEIDEAKFEEFTEQARGTLTSSMIVLENGIKNAQRREQDAIDLERLRKQEAARQKAEQEKSEPEPEDDGCPTEAPESREPDNEPEPHGGSEPCAKPVRTAADDCREKNREALADLTAGGGMKIAEAKHLITLIFQGKIRHISINY